MEKMHYPPGLINFTTENTLQKGIPFRWLRPRLLAYFTILALLCGLFIYQLSVRIPLEVDIIRERSALFRITPQGMIENSYLLKINNMDQRDHQYKITVQVAGQTESEIKRRQPFIYVGQSQVQVAEGEVIEMLVRLQLPREEVREANTAVEFMVRSTTSPTLQNTEISRFIAPAK